MVRPVSLAFFSLLIFATAAPADEEKRQQTIELLDQLFKRAVPTAQVKIIPVSSYAIILTGIVARAEDVDTILAIARAVRGEESGAIINALKVGEVSQVQLDVVHSGPAQVEVAVLPQVQVDLALVRVDRAGLEQADAELYRKYVECFWRLRAVGEAEHQECRALLEQLQNANQALLPTGQTLFTRSGQPTFYQNGGECAVPQVCGLGGFDGKLAHLHLPPGARIHFLPRALADGKIELAIEPEVPTVHVEVIQTGGSVVFVPQNATMRLRSTIKLDDGQTVVHVMPGAFEGDRHIPAESATDLVLLATVHVVKKKTAEDEFEAFLNGILEYPCGK